MVVRANEGFPWLSRRSGHCRNVSRTPVNIRADSGLTRGPGESLPESGRHRKDAVFWTAHAVPGVSLPEISRASEKATSCKAIVNADVPHHTHSTGYHTVQVANPTTDHRTLHRITGNLDSCRK